MGGPWRSVTEKKGKGRPRKEDEMEDYEGKKHFREYLSDCPN